MKLRHSLLGLVAAVAIGSHEAKAFQVQNAVVTPNVVMDTAGTMYGTNIQFKIVGATPGHNVFFNSKEMSFYSFGRWGNYSVGAVSADGSFVYNLQSANLASSNSYGRFTLGNDCKLDLFVSQWASGYNGAPGLRVAASPCQVLLKQSNIRVSSVGGSSATVSWSTNIPTFGQLSLYENGNYTILPLRNSDSVNLKTSHSFNATGLKANTVYHVALVNTDDLRRIMHYESNPQLTVRDPLISFKTGSGTASPTPTPAPTPVATPAPTPAPTPVSTSTANSTFSGAKASCSSSKVTLSVNLSGPMNVQLQNSSGSYVDIGGAPSPAGAFNYTYSTSKCPNDVYLRNKDKTSTAVRIRL